MQMEIGNEIVEAKIKKKEKAKEIFKKAKEEGKAASLLTQHRPNMFTQKIANLIPGLPIKVTLRYVQTIPKIDNDYRLVVPLIVGPRYQPLVPDDAPIIGNPMAVGLKKITNKTTYGQWEIDALPEYPMVFGPKVTSQVDRDRVSIKVHLKAAIPFSKIVSNTHELKISGTGNEKVVTLLGDRTIDNRDFVLNYRLSGANTQAGLLVHRDKKQGYFSLLIEPPAIPREQDITPREMVFVLDTSGSMEGEPMDASKVFMRHAMRNLRQDDYFRIIHFGDNASELTNGPVKATRKNMLQGLSYISKLKASGGTEITPAIRKAFSSPRINQTVRVVVFLTDGYIGNENEVLKLIHKKIDDARIYAFGVGTSVNRFLLSEMGRVGRGFARYIDPTENPNEVAIKLAHKLESPILTDISIDWRKLKVSDVTPQIIPDLFSGDSIRIQGKYEGEGLETIQVQGKVRGKNGSLPLLLNLPKDNYYEESTSAIPLVWARSTISDYMRQINTPKAMKVSGLSNEELEFKVTTLGLNHSLATRWTSFVAVSRRVVNPNPGITPNRKVPLPMVKGTTTNAYPPSISILGEDMAGNSTPEPATVMGMFIIGAAGLIALWVIRRKNQIERFSI
jgi:Ca-activated chloride channel family protein